jgi:hypothetical protein
MMARKKQTYLDGYATHRRTENDYMGVMLESVTLDDWKEVVTGTLTKAKEGDTAARSFLAQYLVGKAAAGNGAVEAVATAANRQQKACTGSTFG